MTELEPLIVALRARYSVVAGILLLLLLAAAAAADCGDGTTTQVLLMDRSGRGERVTVK